MYTLSVDPASNMCGVALWKKNHEFVDSRLLRAKDSKDTFSVRMRDICRQLDEFLDVYDADVDLIISERVEEIIAAVSVGPLFMCRRVDSKFNQTYLVAPATWKVWAKKRGAPGEFGKIKGIPALSASGFPHIPGSDDEADAIMVYLAWKEKYADKVSERRNSKKST